MGKTFVCSLCRNGIIGGGLYIDEQSITYSTQKLTVSPLYRNLVLPMNEIRELSWSQMVVPVAAISMKDGECYKFIIYWRFCLITTVRFWRGCQKSNFGVEFYLIQ